ncbi:MAG: restriction endonuclease, partial [Candidatus Aenigmatarchaeota archaeon]
MLDKIESQIKQGKNIEDILEKYDWQKFEGIITEIFQENGFYTRQNFRFKTKKRHEIDVIAVKGNRMICVDCKWWSRGRYKKAG